MKHLRRIALPLLLLLVLALMPALGIACGETKASVVPTADFSLDKTQAAVGEAVQFTDQSAGEPTAWHWDFGDGNSAEQQNPSHAYAETGSYTVVLKAINPAGSDVKIRSAVVTVAEAAVSTAFTITDDLDKTFSFDAPVTTIVTLAPSNTEVVFAVGAGDKLIGRTDYCNFPPEAASIESVGGFWNPDKEKVVVLDPDVVLANGAHDDSGDTAWLEDKGLTVITLEPQTMADIMDNILMVGKLTGRETEASQLVEDLESRIDYVSDRTAGLTDGQKPRVLHVTWHDPLWTVGADSFINEVIDISGGVNIFADLSGDVQANMDTAVIRNPEVITVVTGHGSAMNTPFEAITAGDSVFKTTDAYVNDRIYLVNADLASRGGPRIIEALEMYARWIHPEIFG